MINRDGYRLVYDGSKMVLEHCLIAERALGRKLLVKEQVHHVNYDPSDNRPDNLVVCPDQSYHRLLHRRTNALDACGHADWEKCDICKRYDSPHNLSKRSPQRDSVWYHKSCNAKDTREYKERISTP